MWTFQRLLDPIRIGSVEIKNRVAMAPMGTVGLLNPDGSPGPRAIEYLIERARGGVGLIITGLFKVEAEIEQWAAIPSLVTPRVVAPFAELTEALHALGSRIFVQLTAGFGRVLRPRLLKNDPVSASAIPYFWDPRIMCRELEAGEVERLVKCFGAAAEILASAGIDGIELHGHEGYLFDQFTTAIWNKRTDKYGGDLRGRLRFPFEVLNEIKQRVGKPFPVQYRFGLKHYMKGQNEGALPGEDFVESGRDIEEGLEMAKTLEGFGFEALHIDAGCYDSHYWSHPPAYQSDACNADMAAAVKRVVHIPVLAVGKLGKVDVAERIIREGKADIVALGRPLLADAYWMRKIQEGRVASIRPCIGCFDGCLGRISLGRPLSCAVNPQTGREATYAVRRADKSRRVMIVGGGVAGLEAARTAALRGHKVTLYEKTGRLGGCLIPAGVPEFKKDLRALLAWYRLEIEALGVETRLEEEVTLQAIDTEGPEVLILANGAHPIIPPVPGARNKIVATAVEILAGEKTVGEKVIVVGGGLTGCETALWLAQKGKRVVLMEILKDVMLGYPPVPKVTREMLLDLLKFNKIKIIPGRRLTLIGDDFVSVIDSSGNKECIKVDTVVLSLGRMPDRRLYESIVGRMPELYLVGDAREARNVMGAVWDGFEVAKGI